MESNKINDLFENTYGMSFQTALDLIKYYFADKLKYFTLVDEYNEKSGYWGIKYSYKGIVIFISCSRGFLDVKLFVNDEKVSLVEFEPLMENAKMGSEKNIRFALGVIKRFVEST